MEKVIQKFRREESLFEKTRKYYHLLSVINSLGLTKGELDLIAFTAIKGNISYPDTREEFTKIFKTSQATMNNIISKLKKLGIFYKDGSKVKINPKLNHDFNKDMFIIVSLKTLDGK